MLDARVEGQGFGAHFGAEVVAHHVAELFDEGVGDKADRVEALFAGADHAALAEHCEVLGDVGLPGAGGLSELPHGAFAQHEEVEESQAHRLGEGPEAGGDHFQGGVGGGQEGSGGGLHEKFNLPNRHMAI